MLGERIKFECECVKNYRSLIWVIFNILCSIHYLNFEYEKAWEKDFIKNGNDTCREWLIFNNPIPNASGALCEDFQAVLIVTMSILQLYKP